MAGHSHWKSIKHRKGAADARRGKIFSKFAKYIMLAARQGGGDPQDNLRLRYAIERARAESMPKDSIERAIKKGTGELQGEELAELVYEGIGPAGVTFVIEVLTDNRNRTGGEMRHLLEKRGGSLGKANSVLWKFEHRGVLGISTAEATEEDVLDAAIEAGAEDIVTEDDVVNVYTPVDGFDAVRGALGEFLESRRPKTEKKWGESDDAPPVFTRTELVYMPQATVAVSGDKAKQVLELFSDLEDHDDVQNVFSDFDISEEILQAISADE